MGQPEAKLWMFEVYKMHRRIWKSQTLNRLSKKKKAAFYAKLSILSSPITICYRHSATVTFSVYIFPTLHLRNVYGKPYSFPIPACEYYLFVFYFEHWNSNMEHQTSFHISDKKQSPLMNC